MEMITLNVKGMSCAHCEKAVVDGLTEIGVSEVTASATSSTVKIGFDQSKTSIVKIKAEIKDMGYEIV